MQTTAIRVTYRFIDGLHVYTSDDVYGLYVANRDPRRAYDAVAPSLQRLISLNEGMDCASNQRLPIPSCCKSRITLMSLSFPKLPRAVFWRALPEHGNAPLQPGRILAGVNGAGAIGFRGGRSRVVLARPEWQKFPSAGSR